MDTQYNIFKSECTMNGGAVQWFWTIIDLGVSNLPIPSVAGQNICDRAIVRCRSSETASLQSCDGRWAFKQDRGEPGTNPFVAVGTVTTYEAAAGSTGSQAPFTQEHADGSAPCLPFMEMSGNEMVNGIEWQMIADPDRENGEADYYYISDNYRLYQQNCGVPNGAYYGLFWVIVERDQEIEGDCEATIGRCRQMELAMCDGSTVGRQWAFLGPKGGRHRFPDVKVDRFWNDCDEEN
eukprot:112278_1